MPLVVKGLKYVSDQCGFIHFNIYVMLLGSTQERLYLALKFPNPSTTFFTIFILNII